MMPGVGVTDAARIMALVSEYPGRVRVSSGLQLLSAALFALAIPGLARCFSPGQHAWASVATALLAVGARGDAADAIYHQLADEMVRPGVDQAAMPLMQRMQTVDLRFLVPMILSFLLGCVALAIGAAAAKVVSKWNPLLYALAVAVALMGRVMGVPGRVVGLTCLGLLGASVVWIGLAGPFTDKTQGYDRTREDPDKGAIHRFVGISGAAEVIVTTTERSERIGQPRRRVPDADCGD
jgi:hypothetical protein